MLRYLRETLIHGLMMYKSKSLSLSSYKDADYASFYDVRRSTCGYYVYLGHSL